MFFFFGKKAFENYIFLEDSKIESILVLVLQELVFFFYCLESLLLGLGLHVEGFESCVCDRFCDVVAERCLAVVIWVVTVRMGRVVSRIVCFVVVDMMIVSKLFSWFGVFQGLCFEGIDLELIDIFLQLIIFLLQLLNQSIVLLNFLTFFLQSINCFKRAQILQMLSI